MVEAQIFAYSQKVLNDFWAKRRTSRKIGILRKDQLSFGVLGGRVFLILDESSVIEQVRAPVRYQNFQTSRGELISLR